MNLRPADPKNDDATGVEVVARWARKREETSEKGCWRELEGSQSGMRLLIQVDRELRQGIGWSLKRFQVVDSDKVIALSKRQAYLARLFGAGVRGMVFHLVCVPFSQTEGRHHTSPNAPHHKQHEVGRLCLNLNGVCDCAILACGSLR